MATLTTVATQTINEDQIFSYTHAVLKEAANESTDVTVFKITALVNGTLKIGTRTITSADITAGVWYSSTGVTIGSTFYSGSLTWTPQADYNGTETAFKIKGATAINGTLSSTDVNVNLTMLSVNDAPSGTNKTITLFEDAIYTFTAADFGFTDVDGNTLLNVVISSLPANDSLRLSGAACTLNQSIAASSLSLLKIPPGTQRQRRHLLLFHI